MKYTIERKSAMGANKIMNGIKINPAKESPVLAVAKYKKNRNNVANARIMLNRYKKKVSIVSSSFDS